MHVREHNSIGRDRFDGRAFSTALTSVKQLLSGTADGSTVLASLDTASAETASDVDSAETPTSRVTRRMLD